MIGPTSWHEWVTAGNELPSDYNLFPTPVNYPFVTQKPYMSTQDYGDDGMDLGEIAVELGTQYLINKFAPSAQAPPAGVPIPYVPAPVPTPNGGEATPAWMKHPHEIHHKRRRRRRRLASASDLRDLASLKAVLGGGTAFNTWIATHSH